MLHGICDPFRVEYLSRIRCGGGIPARRDLPPPTIFTPFRRDSRVLYAIRPRTVWRGSSADTRRRNAGTVGLGLPSLSPIAQPVNQRLPTSFSLRNQRLPTPFSLSLPREASLLQAHHRQRRGVRTNALELTGRVALDEFGREHHVAVRSAGLNPLHVDYSRSIPDLIATRFARRPAFAQVEGLGAIDILPQPYPVAKTGARQPQCAQRPAR